MQKLRSVDVMVNCTMSTGNNDSVASLEKIEQQNNVNISRLQK